MLKNAYSLAILSTDTAETEQNVAEMLTKFRAVTGRASLLHGTAGGLRGSCP